MPIVLITGSAGLIGSEASEFYIKKNYLVVGIDNDMRKEFFGEEGTTKWNLARLKEQAGENYIHHDIDIRDIQTLRNLFELYGQEIKLIIHTAAQPSHDWAARDPFTDFHVNANGTLNLLEMTRQYCPEAVFIFTSTNKVYGDRPNHLPFREQESRWEIDSGHAYSQGIPETFSVDQSLHSLFGTSKLAADVLVQEYGRYFNLKTACFRGGVLSGAKQSGVQLHGFLGYLMKCVMTGSEYRILGYQGKQVRDVIHSSNVVAAFHEFFLSPRTGGEVYNLGGGRESNISILEAIDKAQQITGNRANTVYVDQARIGDHIWYISDTTKLKQHYPNWKITFSAPEIMEQIYLENTDRWSK